VGEVNGDGKADVAVGVYGEDVGSNLNQGRAYVFSTSDPPTPTPPSDPVGGIAELPDASDSSYPNYIALAALAAAALAALTAGVWYVRRRWLA
jgi:hypothetical protein